MRLRIAPEAGQALPFHLADCTPYDPPKDNSCVPDADALAWLTPRSSAAQRLPFSESHALASHHIITTWLHLRLRCSKRRVHFPQPFRLQTLYVILEPLAPTDLWTCEACDRHDIRIGLLGRCIIVCLSKGRISANALSIMCRAFSSSSGASVEDLGKGNP